MRLRQFGGSRERPRLGWWFGYFLDLRDFADRERERFFATDLRSGAGGELAPPALGDGVGLGHRYSLGQAQPESKRVSLKGDPK